MRSMYDVNDLSKYPFFRNLLETNGAAALHDSLTGLIARPFMLQFIHSLIDSSTPFTLILIDLDNFKDINDNYGHKTGDGVLSHIGSGVREFFGNDGIAGRFGGDEFMAVYFKSNAYSDIHNMFDAIYGPKGVFRKELEINGIRLFVTATVGSASFPDNAHDFDTLFSMIDKALYRGKSKGRNCYIIYVESKHAHLEIPTLARRSLYDTFRQMEAAFIGEGTALEKLAWAFLPVQENLRMQKLLWIDGNDALIDIQTGEALGTFPSIGALMVNGMYAATNFRDLYQRQRSLCEALKGFGMESTLIMQVNHHRPEYGFLIVCPEIHTMHMWQDEETAAVFLLCHMLANHLEKQQVCGSNPEPG